MLGSEETEVRENRPLGASLLLTGHGLAGTTPGASVGAGALTTDGQTGTVATTTDATDVLQTLEGHTLLAAQVAFEGVALSGAAQLLHIGVVEILDTGVRVDAGLGQDLLGGGQANPVHVSEGDLDPLLARDIDAGNPSHR